MARQCCAQAPPGNSDDRIYRAVLWAALTINAAMFVTEAAAGLAAGSVSLQADALDFLADAGNYGISLFVLGMALQHRALAALVKGACMGLFGLWVAAMTIYKTIWLGVPSALVMGSVGVLALAANLAVACLLYRHRNGDSNRRSVWICSRNDAIGNVAVVLAASGVFALGTAWPDLAVAAVISGLGLSGAVHVIAQALREMRAARHAAPCAGSSWFITRRAADGSPRS